MASNLAFEYLMYSPDWFLDYYVANGFADCRVYICTFDSVDQLLHGPWRVYAYAPRPDGTAFTLRSLPYTHAAVVVIAEKQPSSTHDVVPVQWCYRDGVAKQSFNRKLAELSDRRPIFGFGQPARSFGDLKPGSFIDCGVAGK